MIRIRCASWEGYTNFEYKPIEIYKGGLLGSESSDNTNVYVSPQGGHQVNYTKTKAGKTKEVTEDVSNF